MSFPQPIGPPSTPVAWFDPCDRSITWASAKSAGHMLSVNGSGPQQTSAILASMFTRACVLVPGIGLTAQAYVLGAGPRLARY